MLLISVCQFTQKKINSFKPRLDQLPIISFAGIQWVVKHGCLYYFHYLKNMRNKESEEIIQVKEMNTLKTFHVIRHGNKRSPADLKI